jgi:hypothetical protein
MKAIQLPPKEEWVYIDFNGMLDRDLVCLSHGKYAKTFDGREVELYEGQILTGFDEDVDENGRRDDIFVTGVVEQSPSEAQCRGSIWSLRFDVDGIRSESEVSL